MGSQSRARLSTSTKDYLAPVSITNEQTSRFTSKNRGLQLFKWYGVLLEMVLWKKTQRNQHKPWEVLGTRSRQLHTGCLTCSLRGKGLIPGPTACLTVLIEVPSAGLVCEWGRGRHILQGVRQSRELSLLLQDLKKFFFFNLAAPGLHCGIQDL